MHRIPLVLTLLAVLALAGVLAVAGAPRGTAVARAATCADHATQAEAQAAKDTRDGDGDGRYCESLPCPCSASASAGAGAGTGGPNPSHPTSADPRTCRTVQRVVRIGLSRTRYPSVEAHWDRAIRKGWPRILTLRRDGAARRRSRLLAGIPTRRGYDRDEYPMASARSSVRADVALVPSGQNRGAGSVQGIKLRRYCSGQRFRIVWY